MRRGDDLVGEMESYIGGDVGCPATKNYPPHKEIVRGLDYTFYIRPRSISIMPDYPSTIKLAPLVLTASSKNSWAERNKFLHVKYDEKEDVPGPITIGAVVWEPKNEKKRADTKIIVFTDADFASNSFINQYSNARLILNSVSWLSEVEQLIPIEAKDIKVEQLNLTSRGLRLVVVVLVAMPLAMAYIGCLVWWRQNINP